MLEPLTDGAAENATCTAIEIRAHLDGNLVHSASGQPSSAPNIAQASRLRLWQAASVSSIAPADMGRQWPLEFEISISVAAMSAAWAELQVTASFACDGEAHLLSDAVSIRYAREDAVADVLRGDAESDLLLAIELAGCSTDANGQGWMRTCLAPPGAPRPLPPQHVDGTTDADVWRVARAASVLQERSRDGDSANGDHALERVGHSPRTRCAVRDRKFAAGFFVAHGCRFVRRQGGACCCARTRSPTGMSSS